jgi:peptidoglycan/LPS O-acetylase OafA/YrhL
MVPAGVAGRVAPLGRASLGVYAVHVPIVYGWSGYEGLAGRVGARLSLAEGMAVAGLVLVASFVVFVTVRTVWRIGLRAGGASGAGRVLAGADGQDRLAGR